MVSGLVYPRRGEGIGLVWWGLRGGATNLHGVACVGAAGARKGLQEDLKLSWSPHRVTGDTGLCWWKHVDAKYL